MQEDVDAEESWVIWEARVVWRTKEMEVKEVAREIVSKWLQFGCETAKTICWKWYTRQQCKHKVYEYGNGNATMETIKS